MNQTSHPKRALPRPLTTAIVVLLILCSFGAGNVTGFMARSALARADEPAEFAIFWEAWDLVVNHFVDQEKIDFQAMTYGAIQGMLDSLGDENHTVFFPPDVAEQQESNLEGSFEGIGAYVTLEDGLFKIVAPIHGSPAEAAGIVAGDVVLAVDGEDITGLPEWEVISRIRGPAGTTVTLTVLHPDSDEPVDIAIVRGRIDIESVLWARIPGTDLVHLQITQFARDTGQELVNALRAIEAESEGGEPVRGILLDLRNNPGGYLQEALQVASQFLEPGQVILHERDAQGQITTYRARGVGLARSIPLIVLVNPGSASAAEIVAGALQENGRARLVGEPTVGTGTVLRPFTLSDGSVLRLGVTNWLTPNQHLIKGQGIQPDVVVEQSTSVKMVSSVALDEMDALEVRRHPDRQFQMGLLLLRWSVRSAEQEAVTPATQP
ncbi:S41 family peptidase [Litorilinea aerophila]|uniref:S41 family peptidase n=1 Tax=Litorilinea aerophila TaxID=1204385 RepID=A0A540VF87_9CHLR|nr:S41 family peptidase [Litorilinea aerophila]MCC9076944.1 S41 family peptidase [Litorilinea aerophila]GIV78520.1 MAG: carboxyl-terminal processing protease [Litorilinea sp.]